MHDHQYLIRAGAPLVFGTGRPLGFGLGGETLPFPFPSTIAGAVRAAAAVAAGEPPDPFRARDSLAIGPSGLVRLGKDLQAQALLLPRPADAVYLGGRLLSLRPGAVPDGCWTDLPDGMLPLELSQRVEGKPDKAGSWWTAQQMQQWLAGPGQPALKDYSGVHGTVDAERTHVVIEEDAAGGADQGGLFRTTGQDFGPGQEHGGHAVWVATQAKGLEGQARRLGGEGRLVRFEAALPPLGLPGVPPMRAQDKKRVRFVLITPAVFERGGWCPDWWTAADGVVSGQERKAQVPGTGLTVRLVAAAISRAQSFSGWQPDEQGHVGPGRAWRVVPAGSVFWFDVLEGDPAELHGRSLCDDRWRNDGWGYGLVGKGGTTT